MRWGIPGDRIKMNEIPNGVSQDREVDDEAKVPQIYAVMASVDRRLRNTKPKTK